MTVIFFAQPDGVPVLVGDMLISGSETDRSTELILPDHMDGIVEVFPKGSGFVPKSMRRKIFVICKNMAVGVSGSSLHMHSFVKELRGCFGECQEVIVAAFRLFIDGYKATDHGLNVLSNMTALVLIKEEREQCDFVVVGQKAKESCTEVATKNFGGVVAIGSGQKLVADEVKRLGDYVYNAPSNTKVVDRADLALSRTLSLISQLNKIDALTSRSLLEFWGGGYEVIYYHNERGFQFVKEYSTIFWSLDLAKAAPDLAPMGLMKYLRMDEYSLIYTYDKGKFGAFGAGDVGAICSMPTSIDVREICFNSGLINNLVSTFRFKPLVFRRACFSAGK